MPLGVGILGHALALRGVGILPICPFGSQLAVLSPPTDCRDATAEGQTDLAQFRRSPSYWRRSSRNFSTLAIYDQHRLRAEFGISKAF